jgi:hypothetical protein
LGNKYNSRIYSSSRDAFDIFGNYFENHDGDDEETDSRELTASPLKKTSLSAVLRTGNKR